MNLERLIDRFEDHALEIRDVERAIKYNWLRNSLTSATIDSDKVLYYLQVIHYKEPNEWNNLIQEFDYAHS